MTFKWNVYCLRLCEVSEGKSLSGSYFYINISDNKMLNIKTEKTEDDEWMKTETKKETEEDVGQFRQEVKALLS
jgi:hypothetical protein